MKREINDEEYRRVGMLVAHNGDLLSMVGREGFATSGRGAVFYCESWERTLPRATPFYLPASEPEFDKVGAEISRAVSSYRPASECVVVVVTERDEVYVMSLKLGIGPQRVARGLWH